MSDRGKVQILQMAGAPTYCRRDNTGGGSFSDLDAQVDKLPIVTAENQDMLVDANDLLYFGSGTAWFGFGLCLNTFGDYGALTWQFYNEKNYIYNITGGSNAGGTGTDYFYITDNLTALGLVAGNILLVTDSTGNDGTYTIVSFTWTGVVSRIVVAEDIPSATFDGLANFGGWMTFVPRYDSTEGFEAHGVVVWGILENFAASTVNTQEKGG